jgi:hypothetical protein
MALKFKWLPKIHFLVITRLKTNILAFSFLFFFVEHLVSHNLWKKSFLTDSKWPPNINETYSTVRKYPNDQFFWHNFFVCGYFSTNFSRFLYNINTHIHKFLSGIYRYLYISWIKKSKNASTESFRTL